MWKEVFSKENRHFETENGILYNGDVLETLKNLPDNSIDCVITSPPYWGQRYYGKYVNRIWGGDPNCKHEWIVQDKKTMNIQSNNPKFQRTLEEATLDFTSAFCKKCGAWYGQLGLEPTFEMYLEHLWEIFDEIYRVLKPTGTVFVNLGDTYNGNKQGKTDKKVSEYLKEHNKYLRKPVAKNVKQKSLLMIPARFAICMIDRGWILRNVIIWQKPNAMPESVKDRFTEDFEYIFFFVKKKKYYFKQILEPYFKPLNRWGGEKLIAKGVSRWDNATGQKTYRTRSMRPNPNGRNKRTVWSINTKPFEGAHFAVFPPDIPEICIKAGCPEDGIVLDPFMGSGTVAYVAEQLKRKWIGIELNPEYCEIARKRLQDVQLKLF